MNEPRTIVRLFAQEMEEQLKQNDHKGDWEGCSMEYLFYRLVEEVGELGAAVFEKSKSRKVIEEAADIGNFAMMIADNYENKP